MTGLQHGTGCVKFVQLVSLMNGCLEQMADEGRARLHRTAWPACYWFQKIFLLARQTTENTGGRWWALFLFLLLLFCDPWVSVLRDNVSDSWGGSEASWHCSATKNYKQLCAVYIVCSCVCNVSLCLQSSSVLRSFSVMEGKGRMLQHLLEPLSSPFAL